MTAYPVQKKRKYLRNEMSYARSQFVTQLLKNGGGVSTGTDKFQKAWVKLDKPYV